MTEFPLLRFQEFGLMTTAEVQALSAMEGPPRRISRHTKLRAEGVRATSFFLLIDGWVASSQTVSDGRRQILKVHLPGDALGTPSMAMTETVEELTALTDATVSEVDLDSLGKLFDQQPRIAAKFLLSIQSERVMLMDRIVSIGRTSGPSRIAALLLDLIDRLEPLGLAHSDSFHMVLTQEQIGDVVGLTAVHTNRSLRAIEEMGLIARHRQQFHILDRPKLAKLADRTLRTRMIDPPWLPGARGPAHDG